MVDSRALQVIYCRLLCYWKQKSQYKNNMSESEKPFIKSCKGNALPGIQHKIEKQLNNISCNKLMLPNLNCIWNSRIVCPYTLVDRIIIMISRFAGYLVLSNENQREKYRKIKCKKAYLHMHCPPVCIKLFFIPLLRQLSGACLQRYIKHCCIV